jgi:hypothetical protein
MAVGRTIMQRYYNSLSIMLVMLIATTLGGVVSGAVQVKPFQGEHVFERINAKATAENWRALPIADIVGKVADQLAGTPYVASTLELSDDTEVCSVNMLGLDCVTFFETALDFGRMLKHGKHSPDDLVREVEFTRYRGGNATDYASRLHYTTDWFYDNQKKHVVRVLSDLPGSVPLPNKVWIMSKHPESSRQLRAHPELVKKIAADEQQINKRTVKYVPIANIAAIEPLLKTGDIVALCTAMPGLDASHTGIVYRTADGVAHFMDASSKKTSMKVTLEPGPISQYLATNPKWIGAIFARPLEP